MENKNRETTSIKINRDLWKEAKKYCIDKNITISELIERLLEREINKRNEK
jgi:antitoxin component of RelBE/YafQ-DinJ toxin-antitoxin module